MKTIRNIIIALSVIYICGCTKSFEQNDMMGKELTITASLETSDGTKTLVQDTSVYWESNDAIKVFYGNGSGKFVSTNTDLARTASFKGSIDVVIGSDEGFAGGETMWGLYPYRSDASYDGKSITTKLPDSQEGRADSFAKNTNISIAKSDNLALSFYNVCGGLRFSVTRDDITDVEFEGLNNEDIAGNLKITFDNGVPAVKQISNGKKKITLTAPDNKTFEKGKWYYIVAAPGTLSKGFKLTLYTEKQCAELIRNNEVSVKRGIFGSVENADEGLTFSDSGRIPKPKTSDEPFFSEGVELMCLIWRLAGAPEYNGCLVTDINNSVEEFFAGMKNHKAVQLAKSYRNNSGIAYEGVTSYGLHLVISDDGEISFNPNYSENNPNDGFCYRWTAAQRADMLAALNDFYKESNYQEWFDSMKPLFDKGVAEFKKICNVNYDWFESFFGTLKDPSHQIILSYLIGGNNNGLSVLLADGSTMSSPVIGCALQRQAGGDIYYSSVLDIIIHEFCHPYCNPLINKYWNEMEEQAYNVYQLVSSQMESQAYGNPNTMMCETFVRSSVIRYLLTQEKSYDKESLIKEQKAQGFLLVGTLVDALEQRELHNDLYPTMDEFMPEFIKAVNEAAVTVPSGKYDEYDNPSTPNLLPGVFSVGPDKKVQFTRSNLYWNGKEWKFESNQMNYPVKWDPSHVGHFFWMATAEASYAEEYDYSGYSMEDRFFCDGSDSDHTLTVEGIGGLRVLDDEVDGEVSYLLESRKNAAKLSKIGVEIEGVGTCLIIAPDDYSGTIASSYDSESWSKAEADGLVCLSPNGLRLDSAILKSDGEHGYYWCGTIVTMFEGFTNHAYGVFFDYRNYKHGPYTINSRNSGFSIRLVKDVE